MFLKDLESYLLIDPKDCTFCAKTERERHMWNLSDKLVGLALFSDKNFNGREAMNCRVNDKELYVNDSAEPGIKLIDDFSEIMINDGDENILPETFVPYLDYKEKQQQWQWIGSGRDSDEQMYELCQQWLDNKDDISCDILETSQGSPPPPRVTTGWTVRPTLEEEKRIYRQQVSSFSNRRVA
ncbi:putative r-kappa-b [Trichonephila clavipes]|nr:putative r-kappa-b [Trichonephila clavipes]